MNVRNFWYVNKELLHFLNRYRNHDLKFEIDKTTFTCLNYPKKRRTDPDYRIASLA